MLCLANISRLVQCLSLDSLLAHDRFCYIQGWCVRALSHKHRVCAELFSRPPLILHAFLYACFASQTSEFSVSRTLLCHITCRVIRLSHCGMLTFRLIIVRAGCSGCTRTFLHASCSSSTIHHGEKEKEEGNSLITTVIMIHRLFQPCYNLQNVWPNCSFIHS